MRFMGLMRADAASEAGALPTPELMAKMASFIEEATQAGVIVAGDGLHPSAKGARVRLAGGKVTVTDGPFTESKELIASYAVLNCASKEEAIGWTTRFLEVLGGGECELRPIFEPTDFPPELFSPEAAAHEAEMRTQMAKNAS